jgi:hypothetical protein
MAGVLFVYRLAKTELRALPKLVNLSELIILLFFLQPRGLFVIEQSWGEPLIVGTMAVAFYFFYYQPAGPLADILFGLMLAIKQYLVFMGLPLVILYHAPGNATHHQPGLPGDPVPFILWDRGVLQLPSPTLCNYLSNRLAQFNPSAAGLLIPRWIGPVAATCPAELLCRFAWWIFFHAFTLLTLFCWDASILATAT